MVEAGDNSPDSITEPKPKLLYLTKKDNVKVRFLYDNDKISKETISLAFSSSLKISCFIENYYTILSNLLLQRTRVLKEKLYLTPLDMQGFSHQKPIYLDKYGCCFYVNKINNYQPNKLTEIELVAILPKT